MKIAPPIVLGIETSCDDTACALLDGSGQVLSSVVSRQLAAHRPFGGVVPEIASREHLKNWMPVSTEALEKAGLSLADVDVVAATRGPGLIGALLVGLSLGKAMAFALDRPFHAMHHLEGHLYSPFLAPGCDPAARVPEEFVGLIVSGGHTSLTAVCGWSVESMGETRDDAMGEAFDKVGKRLGLPYPQGPQVDQLAELGDASRHRLTIPTCGGTLDFSYSGLKTQTIVELEKLERSGVTYGPEASDFPMEVLDLIAGFRAAAVEQLVDRLERLRRDRPYSVLAVSGGVAANRLLRSRLDEWAREKGIELRLVPLEYTADNAAMIAYAALLRQRRGLSDDPLEGDAESRIPF